MGRGRQKAKQTKVARELKYYSPETNYRALEQELGAVGHRDPAPERSRGAVDTTDRPSDWDRWSDDDDDR
ncbi:DUF3073 domain-containing protein [Cellulomonas marina]|uniref:DUF3073 domain-containing protein n=1 Tax=Cellulomonas marina TaxID=988821 RepID=A0A1I0Z333_9CELL|nr:DUF3073 domain-containing protein [Cellulomonas marina]GIG28214.1 hypothetical protein Cma02nite_08140 [Cellulomonas marina]SFB20024.1 Protein of unknown function [Cellulomonas marina]